MKKTLLAFTFLIALLGLTSNAAAQEYKYGVGLRFAYLTPGFAFNYFASPKTEYEGILSRGWQGQNTIITGLYKQHYPLQIEAAELTWYWGVGAHIGNNSGNGPILGADGTIGLEWIAKDVPLGITMDIGPVFDAITYGNDPALNIEYGIGLHYYFK